jgi:hypothetical protein
VIENTPDPSVIPVPMIVPLAFLIVMSVFASQVPVIVGVLSVVANGPVTSHHAELIVGATGGVTSSTVTLIDFDTMRVPVDENFTSVP